MADFLQQAPAPKTAAACTVGPRAGPAAAGRLARHQDMLNHRPAARAQAGLADALSRRGEAAPIQRRAMPAALQAGVERLSGLAMDDVRVHYNSREPATLQAHAFTRGTDIHVAPGQERHLPHEAWHVVQQKQGRVKSTLQAKGIAINDDSALEREADVMGMKALQAGKGPVTQAVSVSNPPRPVAQLSRIDIAVCPRVRQKFVTAIKITRSETTNFDTGAGDHTTAHVVFRHWAENVLLGRTIADVGGVLDNMAATIEGLPSRGIAVAPDKRTAMLERRAMALVQINGWKALVAAGTATDGAVSAKLIEVVDAVLDWRNAVPGSAIEFGGTGHGEGHHAGVLDQLNYTLLGNPAARLSGEQRTRARKAIASLFDIQAASDFTTRDSGPTSAAAAAADEKILPGMAALGTAGMYDLMIRQHIATVAAAYPHLWAAMGTELAAHFTDRAHAGGDPKDEDYVDL